MSTRNYKREASLQSKRDKQNRSERNKARRILHAALVKKYGEARADAMMKGKDVDHITPLEDGGSNAASNLRLRSIRSNRSDKRPVKDPGRNKKH